MVTVWRTRLRDLPTALSSLQSLLLLTYITLIVLAVGGLLLWTGERIAAQTIEQAEHELELQAHIIANALSEPFEDSDEHDDDDDRRDLKDRRGRSLDVLAGSFAENIGGRVTITDALRRVISSSDPQVSPHVEADHAEFVAARGGATRSEIRLDEWRQEERLFVAAPVLSREQDRVGFVQLSVPMSPLDAEMRQTWLSLAGIGGLVLLLTIAASGVLARLITGPVRQLTTTSEQIAEGRLDQRVAPAGPDEIRRLGLSFNRMAARVQEMIAQQRAFVDNAAHELRSPLSGLRLRLELLERHGANDQELTRRYLGQMEREVGYLQRLVDHLLALATVEGQERTRPRVSLDLAPVIYEVADSMAFAAEQAELALNVDVPAHLPPVQANPEQMRMLLRNLVDNAIKYNRRGGRITVTARATEGQVEIRVSDTGTGIPAEALPHIFERFFRRDRARSRREGSVGLGLSLVRSIVEAHGGRVAVESRIDEASTFAVYLPN